jgi:transposase-like protein
MGIETKKSRGGKQKYSAAFKRQVALDYLGGSCTMEQVADRYNLTSKWAVKDFVKWHRLQGEEPAEVVVARPSSGEVAFLERKIADLQAQLDYERMRTLSLETIIDIAEQEEGIDIRKKSVSGQSRH